MKRISLFFALLTTLSTPAFASAGNANDGLAFVLAVTGFLLVAALLLQGVDFLRKNGKMLIRKIVHFAVKAMQVLKKLLSLKHRYLLIFNPLQ